MIARIDPEIARIAVALHLVPAHRVWVIARELVRESGGAGHISKGQLASALADVGVSYSAAYLNRLLRSAEGLFWRQDRPCKRIFICGAANVGVNLVEFAVATGQVDVIGTNRPGAIDVHVEVSGGLEQWEAQIYAAWMAYRECPTISRDALQCLFGRDESTLRRWEQSHLPRLRVRPNYAQSRDGRAARRTAPQHSYQYVANVGDGTVTRLRWRLPSTYQISTMSRHDRRGQSRKVRRASNAALRSPETRTGGINRERRYWTDAKALTRRLRRSKRDMETVYVWRGEDHNQHGIFERSGDGTLYTDRSERVTPLEERSQLASRWGLCGWGAY